MAVVSDGSYGVPEGLISSFPVTTKDGNWTIVQRLGDRRLLPRPHRQVDRRAGRRAQRRHGAGSDLRRGDRKRGDTGRSGSPPQTQSIRATNG